MSATLAVAYGLWDHRLIVGCKFSIRDPLREGGRAIGRSLHHPGVWRDRWCALPAQKVAAATGPHLRVTPGRRFRRRLHR